MIFDSKEIDGDFSSIWELYGLKANPFSTSPLLVKGGILPIESFSGRKEELERIFKQFRSSGGSRILVIGDVGVGKTTFVNVARNRAIQKGYFSPLKEIGVHNDWDTTRFFINTFYAIYTTLKLQNNTNILSKETFDKLKRLTELNLTEIKGGGINLAGIGAEYNLETTSPSAIPIMALHDLFEQIVKEIYKNTNHEIILHYNNLENLPEKSIKRIFEDLRDTFQIEYVHFIFVGNLNVYHIIQSIRRVSSIFSDTAFSLKELELKEIENIINVRIEKLRISQQLNYVIPFDKSALITLYDLYGGNIRHILNSFNTAIIEATKEKPVVLTKNFLVKTLKEIVVRRYLSPLPPNARKVLEEAVKHEEITNRHLSKLTGIARSNISTYLGNLEEAGCVSIKRKDGKDKYWSVDSKIKWIRLKYEDEKQKKLEF